MAYSTAVMPGQTLLQQRPAYGLAGANQALSSTPGINYGNAYGLAGANAALATRGTAPRTAALGNQIDQNRNLAIQHAQTGIDSVNGYVQPGLQANNQQAAMSGVLGPQAQQQAYNNFQESPGQAWLREQAERGVLRNSAAIGGLGGGNVRAELQRQAMGMAQQDWQNQFNNAGAVADRGMQGAALQNSLYNTQSGAATSAGAQHAGVQSAQIGAAASTAAAAMAAQTALQRDRAQYAFMAGQNIGDNYNSTTSALANLANQQGAGMSDMYGNYTGNIANLLAGAGGQQADSNQRLAQLLSGISLGQMSPFVGASQVPGVQQRPGMLQNIGNALQGAGQAASGYAML